MYWRCEQLDDLAPQCRLFPHRSILGSPDLQRSAAVDQPARRGQSSQRRARHKPAATHTAARPAVTSVDQVSSVDHDVVCRLTGNAVKTLGPRFRTPGMRSVSGTTTNTAPRATAIAPTWLRSSAAARNVTATANTMPAAEIATPAAVRPAAGAPISTAVSCTK